MISTGERSTVKDLKDLIFRQGFREQSMYLSR
jgi:hypothetical protein